MTDRELNAVIAEKVMGWKPEAGGFVDADGYFHDYYTFEPSTNRNAAAMVLERIGELGLQRSFMYHLAETVHTEPIKFTGAVDWAFQNLCAASRQISEAALKSVEGK